MEIMHPSVFFIINMTTPKDDEGWDEFIKQYDSAYPHLTEVTAALQLLKEGKGAHNQGDKYKIVDLSQKDKVKGKKSKRKGNKYKKKVGKVTSSPKSTKSIRPFVPPAYATKKINFVPPAYAQKRTSVTSADTENSCHFP